MSIDDITKVLPAVGGAGAMLLTARYVWNMSTDELSRVTKLLHAAEDERDAYARENSVLRRTIIDAGLTLPTLSPRTPQGEP